jgi:hypothetical protein
MAIEELKSIDDLKVWLKAHCNEPRITDYLDGFTQGVVESLSNAGATKVEFQFILEETKRNNGQVAGYLLLLKALADTNKTPTGSESVWPVRSHVVYYLVDNNEKIIGYLLPPR